MRKSLLLPVFAVFFSLISPAHAQFCPGVSPWVFDDVLASDPFCGFVTWMAQNNITVGCQTIDANHRLYCPGANVSRELGVGVCEWHEGEAVGFLELGERDA